MRKKGARSILQRHRFPLRGTQRKEAGARGGSRLGVLPSYTGDQDCEFCSEKSPVLWIAMDVLSDLTVVGVDLLKKCNHGIHQIAGMTLDVALKF